MSREHNLGEREFESYLQGKSELSRLYSELPETGMPKHLDAAILAEAHRAVHSRPGKPSLRNWMVPLSLVASLFVVVMIGLQLPYLVRDAAKSPLPLEDGAPALIRQAPEAAKKATPERAKTEQPRKDPGLVEPVLDSQRAGASLPVIREEKVKDVPAANEAVDVMTLSKRLKDSEAEKVPAAPEASMSGAIQKEESRQRALPAAASPAPLLQSLPRQQPAKIKSDLASRAEDAETWLERIRKLLRENRQLEARHELDAFRKRYPDHSLPADIEKLQQESR